MDKSTDKQSLTPELEARVQRAVDNFMQGYGCCQSVVAAFADLYNLDDTMAKRIAAGFGGGVGRMRMMCGAVSGIVILAGLDRGQIDGADRKGKSMCYKVVQELLDEFKVQNGSVVCAELLGLKGHEKAQSSYVASPRTAEYYKTRPCAAKVESAARIFAEYLMNY
ncbi:C-GCAxxG-C-C family protein [Leyella stercorea]|uniref:C-GCAxxG-C-C family protein n=1 Tax=Leyella stercorea TaxID=363265 RepID=UPI001A59EA55|nr:C-GCAxxG-C-C family protein [Leyella stercorea]MBL6516290.1 C_GCAxxG_C_C family protein [Leyella stercorea]